MRYCFYIQIFTMMTAVSSHGAELLARCFAETPSHQIDIVRGEEGQLGVLERNSVVENSREIIDVDFEITVHERENLTDFPSLKVTGYKMVSSCFPKWCTPERVNVLSLVIHSVFSPDNVDREEDNFLRVYKNLYGFRESIDYCEVVNDKDLYVLNSSNWSENSDLK